MAASPSAAIIDNLFYLYLAIALVVGGLVLGWLGYILVKFRAKPGSPKPRDAPKAGVLPAERGHPLWSYVMAMLIGVIMFGLAFGTISAVTTLETPPAEGDRIYVDVIGQTFSWTVQQRHESGIPVRAIGAWTLPVDTAIIANVTSIDVWHNFALPEYRMRIDAIPGQTNHLWWKANEIGVVEQVCVQICGSGHASMRGTINVVSKDDYRAYLDEAAAKVVTNLARDRQVVNATFDGTAIFVVDDTHNASKAFAVRITNAASATQRFTSPTGAATVEPGASGIVYFTPAGGALVATGTGAEHVFAPAAAPAKADAHGGSN